MKFDFDKVVDRHGTKCLKYDFAKERGRSDDMLPLWVADMDFPTAPGIQKSLSDAVAHGIYGYSEGKMIISRQQPDGMRSISDGSRKRMADQDTGRGIRTCDGSEGLYKRR